VQDLEISSSTNPYYQEPGFHCAVFTTSTQWQELLEDSKKPSTILGAYPVLGTLAHIYIQTPAIYD
jgi:hypothetical protein